MTKILYTCLISVVALVGCNNNKSNADQTQASTIFTNTINSTNYKIKIDGDSASLMVNGSEIRDMVVKSISGKKVLMEDNEGGVLEIVRNGDVNWTCTGCALYKSNLPVNWDKQ